MAGISHCAMCATFMRLGEIEDLEKGLARLTQVPSISLVAIPTITIKSATDIKISLGMVGYKITRTTQVIWIVLDQIMRQHISTAHGKCTSGGRVNTRDPSTTGRCTNRHTSVSVFVAKPLLSKRINIRRLGIFVTIASEPIDAGIFANNPKNIRLLRSLCRACD